MWWWLAARNGLLSREPFICLSCNSHTHGPTWSAAYCTRYGYQVGVCYGHQATWSSTAPVVKCSVLVQNWAFSCDNVIVEAFCLEEIMT